MNVRLADRLRTLLGPAAVHADVGGTAPLVEPATEEACALLLGTATEIGWKVVVEGAGQWQSRVDRGADVRLSTRRLASPPEVNASDLVATAATGLSWATLRQALADRGAWLALDPPGAGTRSLGSVLATGTAGPLRSGFGGVRDHVLGLTLVTGDGRIIRPGGRVVKNVAGFDITKLALGSFGAFGVITRAHLRLRAVPRADVTLAASASRDTVIAAGRQLLAAGHSPAAMELHAPQLADAREWRLALRLVGTDAEVEAQHEAVLADAGVPIAPAPPGLWHEAALAVAAPAVTLRIGALPSALEDALDLLAHHLDETIESPITVSVLAGAIRWAGDADADALRRFRHAAAGREMPVTIERAPWHLLRQVGHFGAYREGTGRLIERLREVYDPLDTLVVPLEASA